MAAYSGRKLEPVFGRKRANQEAEAPHLPSDRKKQAFREFGKLAVLSTFSAQKGAVTSNGDIGKTFSRMRNLAVVEGFSGQNRKLIGYYRPMFLTTAIVRGNRSAPTLFCCLILQRLFERVNPALQLLRAPVWELRHVCLVWPLGTSSCWAVL